MSCDQSTQFILASASARRKRLLIKAGYRFDIVQSNIDESSFDLEGVGSVEHTRRLGLAKARTVAKEFGSLLVLGADTVVDFEGQIVGKPKDAADAERITRMIFSRPHKVITSVALVRIDDGLEIIETAITTVYPKKLTDEQINEHIKNGDWEGKAGAYGIQETGDEFVERIEGSFTNVMGLPMELVEGLLDKFITG
ncbi:MAG: septum formation protein Maf [Planctomycetota bacterium]|nr:MAG: septum formation protein Maf [Planctomycetota bacterium]